jgi:D-serine deaminase-like pyridoxal phosphate-dependent protein
MTGVDPLHSARQMIGRARDEPATPALILDLGMVERNIAEMKRRMAGLPAALRPHAKIHKSPAVAQLQLDAGAIGLTTATVWEAAALIDSGISDVLIANQVVGPVKAAELARIAGLGRAIVAVESAVNARELSAAAASAGTVIDAVVEVDVGQHRSGVGSVDEAIELAGLIGTLPGLRLQGVLGYEGHCMLEPDRPLRIEKATAANAVLVGVADAFVRQGLSTAIVAAGGLGTWDITGANPRITEIHAGSYIFSDAFHRALVPGFEPALTVLGTIVSRTGDMAVIDVGRKAIGIDRAVPELVGDQGSIRIEYGQHFIHEEHTGIELVADSTLTVGDHVELMPGYAPTTVNFYDFYYVVADDRIVDVWPIHARYGSGTAGVGPASA